MRCQICKRRDAGVEKICNYCELAIFQIAEILNSYRGGEQFPQWITEAVREFDFLYKRDPRTRAFFNIAIEIVELAILDNKTSFYWDELLEPLYTTIPESDIIRVLEKAWVIKTKGEMLQVGEITRRLRGYRLLDYPFNSEEMKSAIREMHGVIATAITYALITDVKLTRKYIPRGALSIFSLLSAHILAHLNEDKIPEKIPLYTQSEGLRIIRPRQQRHAKYYMCGFHDGSTRILQDVDGDGNLILKPSMTTYVERIRDRYRIRIRGR